VQPGQQSGQQHQRNLHSRQHRSDQPSTAGQLLQLQSNTKDLQQNSPVLSTSASSCHERQQLLLLLSSVLSVLPP